MADGLDGRADFNHYPAPLGAGGGWVIFLGCCEGTAGLDATFCLPICVALG